VPLDFIVSLANGSTRKASKAGRLSHSTNTMALLASPSTLKSRLLWLPRFVHISVPGSRRPRRVWQVLEIDLGENVDHAPLAAPNPRIRGFGTTNRNREVLHTRFRAQDGIQYPALPSHSLVPVVEDEMVSVDERDYLFALDLLRCRCGYRDDRVGRDVSRKDWRRRRNNLGLTQRGRLEASRRQPVRSSSGRSCFRHRREGGS
jgi:hypothetical protein